MKWFGNLKIRSKLMLSFSMLIVITMITGYLSILNMNSLNAKEENLYKGNLLPISWLSELTDYFQRIRVNVGNIIIAGTPDEISQNEKQIHNYDLKIKKLIAEFSPTVSSDSEKISFQNFIDYYQSYVDNTDKFSSLVKSGQKEKAAALVNTDMDKVAKAAQNQLSRLVVINTNEGREVYLADSSDASRITMILISFMVIGLLIAVVLAIYISKSLSGGITQIYDRIDSLKNICVLNLKKGAEQMAGGDLNVKIETGTKPLNIISEDELGLLARGVNEIIKMIQETVASVEKAVGKVAGLIGETNRLVDSSLNGKLNVRGNEAQFEGGYKKVIEGLNKTLNAISRPFDEAGTVLGKMAEGDLTVRMTGDYLGEYKTLKDSINMTSQSLRKILSEVTSSIEATASAASQISSSAEEIAAGSEEQSSQTSEIATAVEQMTKTILETSRNAQSASEAAKEAGIIAKDGGSSVFDTVEGMERIDQIVSHASEKIMKLGTSSVQIGEIIQVINEIADQTNLLALNAAIEAARAGEQGRGFAVVADEVRKLAERTTKATKEIAQMIKQIQADTEDVVNSVNQGTEEVAEGKILAGKAGNSLNTIIAGSEKVVDIISQVAAASEEQSSAAEQISTNIEGITAVTNQSAAGVQQIARATEDLNRLALNLQELISSFTIDEGRSRLSVRQNGLLEKYN